MIIKPNLEENLWEVIEIYKKAHPLITRQACQNSYNDERASHGKALMEGNDL